MKEPYTIATVVEEFYSLHFTITSSEFQHPVYFYAECSKNPDCRGDNDYYFLELFYSVGEYGTREDLIGLFFGNAKMDKKTIDHEIRDYVDSQLDDTFPILVARYLQKERLLENWLNEQDND